MMDKTKLRKADIFSGGIIFFLGLFIVYQALQMPMKDTYGGVQNVWYVSPAIFPLFIGSVISLLGSLLIGIALKSVGRNQLADVFRYLASPEMIAFLKRPDIIRFYAIGIVFCSFIFVMIPRIDFFIAAIFFLMVFISMFYFDDDELLKKILLYFVLASVILTVYFSSGLNARASMFISYPGDWLMLFFIGGFTVYAGYLLKKRRDLKKKYRTCLILSIVTPFLVGFIFKYLLLVPMPFEGAVVELLDAVWYYEY